MTYLPLLLGEAFIAVSGAAMYRLTGQLAVLGPYLFLLIYNLAFTLIRSDHLPVIEEIMTILLTFYIEATLYPGLNAETFRVVLSVLM